MDFTHYIYFIYWLCYHCLCYAFSFTISTNQLANPTPQQWHLTLRLRHCLLAQRLTGYWLLFEPFSLSHHGP